MKTQLSQTRAARPSKQRAGKRQKRVGQLPIKNILVPTDFSPASVEALSFAVPFAQQFGAKLTLLHVIEPVGTPDFMKSFPLVLENDKLMAAAHSQMKTLITRQDIPPRLLARAVVRHGRSFEEIAAAARTLAADLIIISTHGYTGLKHALLGSTTERVVRHAPCAVMVVRTGKART